MLNPRSCEVPQFPLKLIKVQPEKPISGSCRPVTEGCCGTFLRTLLRSGFLWDLQAFADSPRSKSPNRTPFPRPDAVWWTHPAWSRIEPWLIHHIPLWMNLPNEITSFHCMKSLVCKFSEKPWTSLNSTTWLYHCWQWFHHNCNWWADCLWGIAGSNTTFPGHKYDARTCGRRYGMVWRCWGEKKDQWKNKLHIWFPNLQPTNLSC